MEDTRGGGRDEIKFLFRQIWYFAPCLGFPPHVESSFASCFALRPSLHSYMADRKKCPGCLKPFTSQRAHLAQASSPLCRRLAKKRKSSCLGFVRVPKRRQTQQLPPNSPPIPTNETPSSPEQDTNQSPSPPELPDVPDNENEWDDDDEDGEEDNLNSAIESLFPGWEPPVSNDTDNMSVSSDDMDSDPPSSLPPDDLRERTWVTPQVVKFPNSRAGEPVRSVDSTNNTYATRLREGSNTNLYSPFASKIDWEVAKWAKLRGPSSTSLADLLKIEGVISSVPVDNY